MAALLTEAKEGLTVAVSGIISDGHQAIRKAVVSLCPAVPHQVCHVHSLRQAAKPLDEADRHAKKELKKRVRGIRALEGSLEEENGEEAPTVRDDWLAGRRSLTEDGHASLCASGLQWHDRLTQSSASIDRVAEKRGLPSSLNGCNDS